MATKQKLSAKWKSIVGSVKKNRARLLDSDLKQVEVHLNKLAVSSDDEDS